MNLLTLTLAYLRRNALSAALNSLLLALGIATITVLLLFSHQLEQRTAADARGIDLVVGAKGSPLQLVLSSIFHIDVPTGNIPLADARWVQEHPLVAATIPLALGDSYRGHRIVGTSHAYVEHYGGTMAEGRLWEGPHDVTIGAEVAARSGLALGDVFHGVHGITDGGAPAGGEVHDDHPYRVEGILERTGTVLDRLILTSVESVWLVHDHDHDHDHEDDHGHGSHDEDGHDGASDHHHDHATGDRHGHAHDENGHDHGHDHGHDRESDEHHHARDDGTQGDHGAERGGDGHGPGHDDDAHHAHGDEDRELTALLVQYRSQLGAVTLPRVVNSRNALQAAAPAQEAARLLGLLGVGMDALRAFGWVLILAAGLGVFIGLYNTLKDRRYDLALMRSLGAPRRVLVMHVLLEGVLLALAGALLGLLLGHLGAELLGQAFAQARQLEMNGRLFLPEELWLVAMAVGLGLVAALIPAWQAYRADIAPSLRRQ